MNFDDLEIWEQFNIKSIHHLKRYLKLGWFLGYVKRRVM